MPYLSLFEIPEFRLKSKLIIQLLNDANEYEKGSQEWIDMMNEKHFFQTFSLLENPSNLKEFIDIVNTTEFLDDENPLSIYICL